jgi:hypothetical protein
MAGAGKKTFTAGEVLTASDVNTYLMEQSVMVFGGTAARASAIPTPSTGMTSYIGVTGTATIPQIETYTGSAWQTPYGLTLVATGTIGSGVTTFNMDNVFTSAFRNYQIVINGAQTATIDGYLMQLRGAGTTLGGTGYFYSGIETQASGSTITQRLLNGGANWRIGISSGTNAANSYNFNVDVFQPAIATATNIFARATTRDSGALGNVYQTMAGSNSSAVAYDGFTLSMSGAVTMTGGTVQVYGIRTT